MPMTTHTMNNRLFATLAIVCCQLLTSTNCAQYTMRHSFDGRAAAYADFDANSLLDTFVIDNGAKSLTLYLAQQDFATPTKVPLFTLPGESDRIVAVAAADFNGDSRVDLLVTKRSGERLGIMVSYGIEGRHKVTEPALVVDGIDDQPMLLDYNADMVSDWLGAIGGKYMVYLGSNGVNKFTNKSLDVSSLPKPSGTASNLFVDFNADLRADLILGSGDTADSRLATVATRSDAGFQQTDTLARPPDLGANWEVGQLLAVDIDNDKFMDLAVPACQLKGQTCSKSYLFIYLGGAKRWCTAKIVGFDSKYNWLSKSDNPLKSQPIQLRLGGSDGNSRVNLLGIVHRAEDKLILPVYFTMRLDGKDACNYRFVINELPKNVRCTESHSRLALAAFADIEQDGGLDILTVCSSSDNSKSDQYKSQQFSMFYNEEGYFFRVMILSGQCSNQYNCPDRRLPVGLPVPGPCILFSTERPDGGTMYGIGCQVTQSAYSQLDLPFLHFGLGQFSNYIDRLTVAIPYSHSTKPRKRDFTFIIPNSQLVVIPYPNDEPASWTSELFVKPFYDKQVLYVGITLLSTCLIACCIAAIFQCIEYKEDKRERGITQQAVVFDPSGR